MKNFLTPCFLLLTATQSWAQEDNKTTVAFGLSTLGGNLEVARHITPTIRLRGIYMGGINANYETTFEGYDFAGDFQLGGIALLGDYYPAQGAWRVSGGLHFSTAGLTATGTTDIDGYGPATVDVSAKFANKAAPMITTGFDLYANNGWGFHADAGAIFAGGIALDFTSSDSNVQDEADNDPDLREAKQQAEDITLYPYIGLTLSYRF